MARAGLRFHKKLGQNFLIDGHVVSRMVDAAGIGPGDPVLEIGPGIGTLTEELLLRGSLVLAMELDRTFFQVLQEEFQDSGRFHLLEGDALKLDPGPVMASLAPGRTWQLVANLPYYITGPLLQRFLRTNLPIECLTIMVQKEVAERIMAAPGSSAYGALTLLVALYAEPSLIMSVPASSFLPAPKVDSAVVQLKRKEAGPLTAAQKDRLNALIRLAFEQRRKMVIKAIERGSGATRADVLRAFEARGLDPRARAENLSLADFTFLAQKLGYIKKSEPERADFGQADQEESR